MAAVWKSREDVPANLLISQVRSPVTTLPKSEILLQGKSGKGLPYIMAIMDDVITGITGVEINADKA